MWSLGLISSLANISEKNGSEKHPPFSGADTERNELADEQSLEIARWVEENQRAEEGPQW